MRDPPFEWLETMETNLESSRRERRAFIDRLSREPGTVRGHVEAIATLTTEACARLLEVERVGVWLFDETETELCCVDNFDRRTGRHSAGAVLREHEFAAEFAALKSALYVDASEPLTDPRTAGYVDGYVKPNRITSMLDVVVRFGGKNLGTLCFEHVDRPHHWRDDEIDFACMVGAQLSVLLERRALRASQELDALKSQFLANVSHELRTPLTLMLGPIEELVRQEGALTDEQRRCVEMLRRGGVRLRAKVNALLDFVALEAGRLAPQLEPTDLAALTRQLVSLFEPSATKAKLALHTECELEEPACVDRDMWEKIVLNLLSNAIKFTLEGEIVVTLRAVGDEIVLVVRDTGVGIPKGSLPHVFERFYRVSDGRGHSVEGTGIGLPLVKELVEIHGGTVTVESELGVGTSLRVALPRSRVVAPGDLKRHDGRELATSASYPIVEEVESWLPREGEALRAYEKELAAAGASQRDADRSPSRRPRVLVVDDNADMRAYLERVLGGRYAVETARDGLEALDAVRTRAPDLVVTDLMMPRLDGIRLLESIRAEAATKCTPVIVLSARGGEAAMIGALTAGADDYVCKPFSPQEILARVATHIDLARMRREAAESALKDTFLGLAAHELRTPLTSLKLRLQLADQRLTTRVGPDAREHLGAALRALDRAESLANELLSMSALESRRVALKVERVDLVALCRSAAAEESASIGRPVTLDLPDAPVEVNVDHERICEVVKHLLSNALKFSPPWTHVRLRLVVESGAALVSVSDEGPGIPPAEVPHLFERFHRVPGIEARFGSRVGLGIGLHIARALAELHGGTLTVETNLGQGSTFTLRLPRP